MKKEKPVRSPRREETECEKPGTEEPSGVRIATVRPKAGEGPDNLKRRGEWFSRRVGKK